MSDYRRFEFNPTDYERLPWAPGCAQCQNLLSAGEPGLFTWLLSVAHHFQDEHQVTLVGAGGNDR